MLRFRLIVMSVLVLTLAACAGQGGGLNQTPGDEDSNTLPSPQITSISREVAAPGESLVVAGSGFGSEGQVLIGGTAASIVTWADSEIELTVESGTPGGPQELVVATDGQQSDPAEVFVGTEYDGTPDGLGEYLLALPAGSAVLLPEGEFELPGDQDGNKFVLMDVGLYGSGETKTTLLTPDGVLMVAQPGQRLVIDGATLETGDDVTLSGDASSADFSEIFSLETGRTAQGGFGPLADEESSILLSNVKLIVSTGEEVATHHLSPTTVTLQGVTCECQDLVLLNSEHVQLLDVHLEGTGHLILAGDATLEISDSTLNFLTVHAYGNVSVDINSSAIAALDGYLTVAGGPLLPGFTELEEGSAGSITISGSSLTAADAEPSDGTEGELVIGTQFAPILLEGNELIRSDRDLIIYSQDSNAGEADIILRDNAEVRAGSEDLPIDWALIQIVTLGGDDVQGREVRIEASKLFSTTDIIVYPEVVPTDVTLLDSEFETGTVDEREGLYINAGHPGTLVAERNIFNVVTARLAAHDIKGGDGRFVDNLVNVWNLHRDEAEFEIRLWGGDCTIAGNEFNYATPDEDESFVQLSCQGGVDARDLLIAENDFGSFEDVTFQVDYGNYIVTGNQLSGNPDIDILIEDAQGVVSNNGFVSTEKPVEVQIFGPTSSVDFVDNVLEFIELGEEGALQIVGEGSITVRENLATGQNYGVALSVEASDQAMVLDVFDNVFSKFEYALKFSTSSDDASIAAKINDNVFDFVMDFAGSVATLTAIRDVLDATGNVWGPYYQLSDVEALVHRDAQTIASSGDILLDPIKVIDR